MNESDLERLFARWVEEYVVRGVRLEVEQLCATSPELAAALRECIGRYDRLERTLSMNDDDGDGRAAAGSQAPLPAFEGFRTLERIGGGGGGEVYKLEDLELGRFVAGKLIRVDGPLGADLESFLREARTMALFDDPRIVRLLEYRGRTDPPVLLMEYVDGFPLDRLGPSLEYRQRARVMAEIAEAIHHAHTLDVQHRDLKPANVLVDSELRPRILDFGLSRGEPLRGHGRGTPAYMAPEQLDRTRPIDARTDVYALGVMLYELLCGARPYDGVTTGEIIASLCEGKPRLPVEVSPGVPEPLQAIALKAMEREPDDRYASALELSRELRRAVAGDPVLARPTLYRDALERRVRPHVEQIREWLRTRLIYPHEAERLRSAYRTLEAREDDWIVESRVLSTSQIALYLGAFLMLCGSLFFFSAYLHGAVSGMARPILVLGLPFVGLNLAGTLLDRRDRKAVAVAYYLAATVLLPLFLLTAFGETGLWPPRQDGYRELFGGATPSNRQLQVAALAGCLWAAWLARRTRTVGLSSGFTALLTLLGLTLLADFGLSEWIDESAWDLLALHLAPLVALEAVAGYLLERQDKPWFARPLYYSGLLLFVVVLELLALDGRTFAHIGVTLAPLQGPQVSDPLLLDTLAAMTLNGVLIYGVANLLERTGTPLVRGSIWMLYLISPFAVLQPVGWLVATGEYSRRFDWLYLALALVIAVLSHYRQRRSFYFAGLLNTGTALWLITDHHEWFDKPWWGATVVTLALLVLGVGLGLDGRERFRRREDGPAIAGERSSVRD